VVRGGQTLFRAKGKELWRELLTRDYEKGGLSFLILGPKGQGKSTLLATIALTSLQLGDIVVWRGRERDFWPRLPRELTKVFVHENDELKIFRLSPGKASGEDITGSIEVSKFKSIEDLYNSLEPGKINVIYEPTYHQPSEKLKEMADTTAEWLNGRFWWFDFFIYLSRRIDARFMTVCIDEIDDLFPSGSSGLLWRALESIQHSLAEFREKLIWLFGTTHDAGHVDPRTLKKFDGFIYLRGAIAPKRSTMPDKNAPAKLSLGQGIIEIRGRGYGGFEFEKIPHDGYLYAIQKRWIGPEVHITKKSIKDEITKIAEEEGVEKAMAKLQQLRLEGRISERYYYILKSSLARLELS